MRLFSLLVCLSAAAALSAQDVGFGFRTGLNFNYFIGDKETGPGGEELEAWENSTGFHVGASFNVPFTDLVGLRAEIAYHQAGGRIRYDGPSYFVFPQNNGNDIVSAGGTRNSLINVTNGYIQVPVLVYYKPVEKIEIMGGAYASVLVSSVADGQIAYGSTTVSDFALTVDYNYIRDELDTQPVSSTETVSLPGQDLEVPEAVAAYYFYDERPDGFFKSLDFGLTGGLSVYLNQGLYVGARGYLGLNDVTNNFYDRSLQTLNADNSFVERSDNDQLLTVQAMVGFLF